MSGGLSAAANAASEAEASIKPQSYYVLHLDQENPDVRWTKTTQSDDVSYINPTERGIHFLYCLLFCINDEVDMQYYPEFKRTIKLPSKTNANDFGNAFEGAIDEIKLFALPSQTWHKMQLQFLVESRLLFTAYNVVHNRTPLTARDIVILAPAIYVFFNQTIAFQTFLKHDDNTALFENNTKYAALRLVCAYIVFSFTGDPSVRPSSLNLENSMQYILPYNIEKLYAAILADHCLYASAVCYSNINVACHVALNCEANYAKCTSFMQTDLATYESLDPSNSTWITAYAGSTLVAESSVENVKKTEVLTCIDMAKTRLSPIPKSIEDFNLDHCKIYSSNNNNLAFLVREKIILCCTSLSFFKCDDAGIGTPYDMIKAGTSIKGLNSSFAQLLKTMVTDNETATSADRGGNTIAQFGDGLGNTGGGDDDDGSSTRTDGKGEEEEEGEGGDNTSGDGGDDDNGSSMQIGDEGGGDDGGSGGGGGDDDDGSSKDTDGDEEPAASGSSADGDSTRESPKEQSTEIKWLRVHPVLQNTLLYVDPEVNSNIDYTLKTLDSAITRDTKFYTQ
jgi:hypothetical protein